MDYVDTLIERAKMLRDWKRHEETITRVARELLPDAEVYVFGSIVRGEAVGGSDVDVLIKSDMLPRGNLERARIKIEIENKCGLPLYHPFEIHFADSGEMKFYSRIKELTRIL